MGIFSKDKKITSTEPIKFRYFDAPEVSDPLKITAKKTSKKITKKKKVIRKK